MALELVKIDERTKIKLQGGIVYEATFYEIGRYQVEHYVKTLESGKVFDRVNVCPDWTEEYLPEIEFDDEYEGHEWRRFYIQTASYGPLEPDDIREVVAGYQEALEVVEVLTEAFC